MGFMKISLQFPKTFFDDTFYSSIAKNSLGVRGDDLLLYLKNRELNMRKKNSLLFSQKTVYCVSTTKDGNNILLVGTQI